MSLISSCYLKKCGPLHNTLQHILHCGTVIVELSVSLQPRAYNKNKSGALLFLSPRCKLQHSPHSLFPPTQHYREGESVHCDGICILGSKIIVHQIWIGSKLLAVDPMLLVWKWTQSNSNQDFFGDKMVSRHLIISTTKGKQCIILWLQIRRKTR